MLKLKNNARDIRVPKTTVTPIPQKLDSEPFFHTLFFFVLISLKLLQPINRTCSTSTLQKSTITSLI